MPSPFPGMGPYLEDPARWPRVRSHLIAAVQFVLNAVIRPKYLAVIESDLKTSATSRVGAAGPWQFMPGTARDLGLKVNRKVCLDDTDSLRRSR